MNSNNLILRQRKLLNYIQNQKSYVTGTELATYLQVSPRTIRNDITEINSKLFNRKIQIISVRSKGYMLEASNPETLNNFSNSNNTFLTREDRVRYIAFKLCLSDSPINIYDFESEMFISHTTLDHDLQALRKKYFFSFPHIKLMKSKDSLTFEHNERKRRAILNALFHEDWDYNSHGNAYYNYEYVDEQVLDIITNEVKYFLNKYSIQLEDLNNVTLNLSISIMYHRIQSGYKLNTDPSVTDIALDTTAKLAVDDILTSLEKKLNCQFDSIERFDIYLYVSSNRLMDASKLNFDTVAHFFSKEILHITDVYLQSVKNTYHIDLSLDEDFYITLLQYVRYLQFPMHNFIKIQDNSDIARANLIIEFEIAYLFQNVALKYMKYRLNYIELLYLAFCISGALKYRNQNIENSKFKTVILCHLNLYALWSLKRRLLDRFNTYIDIVSLLPVSSKDNYDFSKVDLIITTVNKKITDTPNPEIFYISPLLTQIDQTNLELYLLKRQSDRLYSLNLPPLQDLFNCAFWHEKLILDDKISIIKLLASDFINEQLVSPEYLSNILQRESILTFAFQPGIVLMYSLVPSMKTCLSIATLEHRIKWNNYKIRTIIMVAIKPEHATIIFKLFNNLFYNKYNLEYIQSLKTKDELMKYLQKIFRLKIE